MQMRLTSREVLQIAGIGDEALKSMRRRHQIALAFGGDDSVAAKMYLPVDAVALMLSSTLARTYGASLAASLVRASADMVLIAGAQAEASKNNVPYSVDASEGNAFSTPRPASSQAQENARGRAMPYPPMASKNLLAMKSAAAPPKRVFVLLNALLATVHTVARPPRSPR